MKFKKGSYILMRVTDDYKDDILKDLSEYPIYKVLDIYHTKFDEDVEYNKEDQAMKCIKCKKEAVYIVHDASFCEECAIEYAKEMSFKL